MKKVLQLLVLVAVLMISFSHDADAQKRKKSRDVDEYFDDKGNFVDRLWYGADFNLNFYSVQGGNGFNAGISPMVGYKIFDALSVGPRIELLNSGLNLRNPGGGDDIKLRSFNYGIGLFTRLKVFQQYFIHAEFQQLNAEIPRTNSAGGLLLEENKILTNRGWEDHFFLGAGYGASGGGIGFQASILWDVLQEFSSGNLPIYYRIGINYKF